MSIYTSFLKTCGSWPRCKGSSKSEYCSVCSGFLALRCETNEPALTLPSECGDRRAKQTSSPAAQGLTLCFLRRDRGE